MDAGHALTKESDVGREITVAVALSKSGSGVRKRNLRSRRGFSRDLYATTDYLDSLGSVPAAGQFLFRSREGDNLWFSHGKDHRIDPGSIPEMRSMML